MSHESSLHFRLCAIDQFTLGYIRKSTVGEMSIVIVY